jgi:NADH:ubiquinone oxidoreductase subunit H
MTQTLDQIFVIAAHRLLSYRPRRLSSALLGHPVGRAAIIIVFPLLFAITTWLERKGLGRIQNRYGPNRVGPCGILQPIADGVKSLTKEDIVPITADHAVHFLAPVLLVAASFLGYAVLPIGRNMVLVNLNAGVLYFFAVGSMMELAVFMAGWSSRSKYSLLGAMRAIAQMISYEVPLVLASIVVIMQAGSLSTVSIVDLQAAYTGIWPHWFVFTPWGFAGFVLFMIAATAESNRSPFDLPEGESEIIAGYYIGILRFQVRPLFPGRIYRHVCHQRNGNHPIPRRMVRSILLPHVGSILCLVLRKTTRHHLRLHLDSRDPPPPAHGPVDESCMGVHASHGPSQSLYRRPLALHGRRISALACLQYHGCRSLHPAEPRAET